MSRTKRAGKTKSHFIEMLEKRWQKDNFVCVGLDSQYDRIPEMVRKGVGIEKAMFRFNKEIIDTTHDLVCVYKANIAFYEAQGSKGLAALIKTSRYIHAEYPGIPLILDAKRADIGNTNLGYVEAAFNTIGVDAITVHPFLGQEALQPFLDQKDKGIIVLCRTSNPGAGEFQDLIVDHPYLGKVPLYQVVAYQVAKKWNKNGNCCLVVGATYPEESVQVRKIAPDLPFLIPGIGKQGGDVEKTVKASQDSQGLGMIINSSRGIIFASEGPDFAQAARRQTEILRAMINQYRKVSEKLTKTQEKLALSLFEAGAIQFDFKKGWRLKLHEQHPNAPLSPFYIDLRILQSRLEAKQKAVSALIEQADGIKYDCLAGIPLAAVALASSMSDKLGKPQITPRMDKKTHGQIRKIDGVYRKGEVALVVDDLVTRADSKLEAIKVLEENGLVVKDVVVVFDREQGGAEQLAEKGYTLHTALKIKPTLRFYVRAGKITQKQLTHLLDYLAAPLGK
ncbi:MAG TPA: orotidine-5'-phosphate decarboxylase [Nevskiaceae bacterium]|nr:orotidine-5'-phosphate decarboxylase [Nevskiaceae bacterium]